MDIDDVIAATDVIATATGAKKVVSAAVLDKAKDGVFVLNVGHVAEEIDCEYLRQFPNEEMMPFINAYRLSGKSRLSAAAIRLGTGAVIS